MCDWKDGDLDAIVGGWNATWFVQRTYGHWILENQGTPEAPNFVFVTFLTTTLFETSISNVSGWMYPDLADLNGDGLADLLRKSMLTLSSDKRSHLS